ncbi:MAG TPA: BrnT family toxin [Candidatus Binatia bacterium]|nr:BrnT family toxin [Candidatus Binatia bacterium]
MEFEWDPRKARDNERKHGVHFQEAVEVFGDDHSSTVADPDHSLGEARYLTFGRTKSGRCLVVGFTERGDRLRLISARPMTRQERQAYES